MPGHTNKKQTQRTKGNVRPSSSSQAAQLLSSIDGQSTGFIGFGSLASGPGYVPVSEVTDDPDNCLDADFRMVLRKLSKRDSTTKIKALQEFSVMCKDKDEDVVKAVLPFWPRIFNKMAIDVDHRVRESTQQAMCSLILRVRRNVAPFLKSLMGTWLLAQCDTYPTVASAAQQAFGNAFPPAKQSDVIVFCKGEIIQYLIDNLLVQTPTSLSDAKTTPEEDMTNKYNRILTSSLLALRKLLFTVPAGDQDALQGSLSKLLENPKFWKLGKANIVMIKGAFFGFLACLCQTNVKLANQYGDKISPVILHSLDETDAAICAALWEAALSTVSYVEDCWKHINFQKAMWPKLKSLLTTGCHGNAITIGPNLLPFLSKIPAEISGGAVKFQTEFLANFRISFDLDRVHASPSECAALVTAFMECLQYITHQWLPLKDGEELVKILMLEQALPVVELSLTDQRVSVSRSPLYSLLSTTLRSLEDAVVDSINRSEHANVMVTSVWDELRNMVLKYIPQLETLSPSEGKILSDKIVHFIRCIVNPNTAAKGATKTEKVVHFCKEPDIFEKGDTCDSCMMTTAVQGIVTDVLAETFKNAYLGKSLMHLNMFAELLAVIPSKQCVLDAVSRHLHINQSETPNSISDFVRDVCLPWIKNSQGQESEARCRESLVIDVVFSLMHLLDSTDRVVVLENFTKDLMMTRSHYNLLSKALHSRHMTGVHSWLTSSSFGDHLIDLAEHICSYSLRDGAVKEEEVEKGWQILTQALTFCEDAESLFKQDCLCQILETIHQTLLKIATDKRTDKIEIAVQFVSKATVSLFSSMKSSYLMKSSEQLVVGLFSICLDEDLRLSTNTKAEAVFAWTLGVKTLVAQTGGFVKENGYYSDMCSAVKNMMQTKVTTLSSCRNICKMVDHFAMSVMSSLPDADRRDPTVQSLLRELKCPHPTDQPPKKLLDFLIIKGTLVAMETSSGSDDASSLTLTQIIYSAIYNAHILYFMYFEQDSQEGQSNETNNCSEDWSDDDLDTVLDMLYCSALAEHWMVMNQQVKSDSDVIEGLNQFEKQVSVITAGMSAEYTMKLWETSLMRSESCGGMWAIIIEQLLSTLQPDLYSSNADDNILDRFNDISENSLQALRFMCARLSIDDRLLLLEINAVRLISCPADSIIEVNGAFGPLSLINRTLATLIQSEVCNKVDILTSILDQLLEWREAMDSLLLFTCNLSHASTYQVALNVEIIRFMNVCVTFIPQKLSVHNWDFILCGMVAWIQSLEESKALLLTDFSVQSVCVAVCDLLSNVADCIQKQLPSNPEAFPPDLATEWHEFFSDGSYSMVLPLFLQTIGKGTARMSPGPCTLLMTALANAVSLCPKSVILASKLPLYLVAGEVTHLPDNIQSIMNHFCPLLVHPDQFIQVAAFSIIDCVVEDILTYDKDSSEKDEEQSTKSLPCSLMKVVNSCCVAMEIMLDGFTIEGGLVLTPFTEEYQYAFGYLMTWRLILRLFKGASNELRAEYASFLQEQQTATHMLRCLFCLMPNNPVMLTGSNMFEQQVSFSPNDCASRRQIEHVTCSVYKEALETIPAMVRQWWKDQDRKTAAYIDKFTGKYVSHLLSGAEILSVQTTNTHLDSMTIKARPTTKEVIATYVLDEVSIEIVITLPQNYPLGSIAVHSEKRVGVNSAQWDKWLLQLNIFLQHQNGTIIDGLLLWKRNIDKRFEGVDDCMICYSVLHGTNFQLPRLQCKTCKKKYHSACLYKWFSTSHKSACPMCRNLF